MKPKACANKMLAQFLTFEVKVFVVQEAILHKEVYGITDFKVNSRSKLPRKLVSREVK